MKVPESDSPDAISSEQAARPIEQGSSAARPITQLWWLTGICLMFAIALGVWSWFRQGLTIHIRFRDGYGLQAENRLMHRGIEVGIIERVRLDKALENVEVRVRLNPSANDMACAGSRFWIERPIASVQGVRSLETILTGRYIAVEPGPPSTDRVYDFVGLEQPPPPAVSADALEVVLEASERHGLQANAPIIYRGLEVGRIQSIGLSADSRWVQLRIAIEAEYRNLVRENSRFWNRSGVRIDVGLSGVDIDAESLSSIALGGIEFATPDSPGQPVKTGRRFELASRADEAWLEWRPRMLYGAVLPKGLDVALSPSRIVLHWQERLFGFRRNESRMAWMLMLSDGTVLAPSDVLEIPANAIDGSVRWEVAGVELEPERMKSVDETEASKTSPALPRSARVSHYRIEGLAIDASPWPVERLAAAVDPSIESKRLWIAFDHPGRWIPIEAYQRSPQAGDDWLVDASLGLSSEQHGAPVVDSDTGRVVGFVIIEKRSASIRRLR